MMKTSLDITNPIRPEAVKFKNGVSKVLILNITGIAAFILIWYLLVALNIVDKRMLISPIDVCISVINKLVDSRPDGATLFVNIGSSFLVAILGFLLAILIGTPLGLLMGWYKPFDRFVRPVFEVIRPIPPIAWIPLTILFLGIGIMAKAFIIFFSAFVPTLINSYTGIILTNPVLINVAKTCGASNRRIFLKVGIPSAMPMVFAGFKISLGSAWSTLVAAEMLAANKGLGYMILMGRQFMRIDIIIGGMIVIGVIGNILDMLLTKVENSVIKWRVQK
ncbi:ABC transporter permease [Petroclostridium sp. X23]|uniref:ABC transporter permease n=1 Tax=Petroclostridium sp. X23 TaxID=3045146 RepID=UPI0024ACF566|nr:ABC transporter permease [Petroclostridium sp. X23]WHH60824.1 ABC transporter permease [Petroclostridium sp. X23]